MSEPLRYQIRPLNPAAHLFEVHLTVPTPDPDGQVFTLPAWIPGSYMIRDYARHIVALRAESDGIGVELSKLDKSTWQAASCERELTVVAEIYAHDESVRGAHLDTTHAYFNGSCMFFEVRGQEDSPCCVDILNADQQAAKSWRVATSMQRAEAEPYGFGGYVADNYAELIDHPVEIGDLAIGEFDASGIPHAIAIRGKTRVDMARLCRDLKVICEQHIAFLGKPLDLDRYLFLLYAPATGHGGLEHRWSSSLVASRDSLPIRGDDAVSKPYRQFLGLVSHEYFHLWNVKRMKPAAFTPYNLDAENYTELLWVFEGVTSYYDDLALLRSGLITVSDYLELLGQIMTRVVRGPGRKRQSVAESSYDAWTKFYKQDANSINSIVSYYAKGALIALALDLKLRSESAVSLDDVMTECWRRFGDTGAGMDEAAFEEIAMSVSGLDLSDFFDASVRGTGELPLEALLRTHGIEQHLRTASGADDKGGVTADLAKSPTVWLGANLAIRDGATVFVNINNDGPAEKAGVSPGDELVAIDGIRIGSTSSDTWIRRYRDDEKSELTLFRGDELMTVPFVWESAPSTTCYLTESVDADEQTEQRRQAWLSEP